MAAMGVEFGRHWDRTVDMTFGFADGLISEIRVFQQDTHALLATLAS